MEPTVDHLNTMFDRVPLLQDLAFAAAMMAGFGVMVVMCFALDHYCRTRSSKHAGLGSQTGYRSKLQPLNPGDEGISQN